MVIMKPELENIWYIEQNDKTIWEILGLPSSNCYVNTEWERDIGYIYHEFFDFGISILFINNKLDTIFFFMKEKDGFKKTDLSPFNFISIHDGIKKIEENKLYDKKEILNNGRNINYFVNNIKINLTINTHNEIELLAIQQTIVCIKSKIYSKPQPT
jgi:hypothetical protein